MREIKFRAKRTDGLGWVNGFFVKTPITAEFNAKDGQFFDSGWEGRYCIVTEHGVAHEIDVSTLAQFTGLKDKNGKEVYQGDIVKTPAMCGEIDWDERELGWIMRLPGSYTPHRFHEHSPLEVIGNIARSHWQHLRKS